MHYKYIEGYDGYRIYEDGQVFSEKSNRFLKPQNNSKNKQGKLRKYLRVQLCQEGVVKKFAVARLVAEAFIPNPEDRPEVNHKDGNRFNNHVSNLEWNTTRENFDHAIENDLILRGERIGQSIYTEDQVRAVRSLRESGLGYQEISLLTGVTIRSCRAMVSRQNWAHVI